MLAKIGRLISQVIFAQNCIVCKCEVMSDNQLCYKCWQQVDFISTQRCDSCGKPAEHEFSLYVECECRKYHNNYTKLRSALVFNDTVAGIVHDLKYNDVTCNIKTLARWMQNAGEDIIGKSDIICPVPLHISRLRQRKYNQALLLAANIKAPHLRLIPDLLIKTKETCTQTALNRKKRMINISGSFAINSRYKNEVASKKILLVDDVLTTGATANECAKILKLSKASEVHVLTLAQVNK
jgi:ComF family protein